MAGTVKIVSFFDMVSLAGSQVSGKQGTSTNPRWKPLNLGTTNGVAYDTTGSLADDTATLLYTGATDLPATFEYGFFWASVATIIQLIDNNSTGTNVKISVPATVSFMFSGTLLAAADETAALGYDTDLAALQSVTTIYAEAVSAGQFQLTLVD